jgi:hypothetical protein
MTSVSSQTQILSSTHSTTYFCTCKERRLCRDAAETEPCHNAMAAKLFDYTSRRSRRVRGELRARQNRSDAATDVPSEKPSADDSRSSDSGSESLRCALIVITVVKVLYNCTITIVRVLLSNYCSVLTVLLLMRWLRWLRSSGTIRTAGPSSATSGKSGALCISDHARRIARRRGTQCHPSGPMIMIRHAISL